MFVAEKGQKYYHNVLRCVITALESKLLKKDSETFRASGHPYFGDKFDCMWTYCRPLTPLEEVLE